MLGFALVCMQFLLEFLMLFFWPCMLGFARLYAVSTGVSDAFFFGHVCFVLLSSAVSTGVSNALFLAT